MTPPLPSGTGLNDLLVVWDAACLRHDPGGEVWLGKRDTGTEVAERARVLLAAVQAEGARVLSADKALMGETAGTRMTSSVTCARCGRTGW
jgi:hypothetical protein